ncbi:MAG TPA: phosphotransferase [Gaiellaceae bacterium]|nr:phosphotransferase [Gaiellaceae bacterium]
MDAAVAVARRLGLRVDEPVVLRAAWNVLVHLRPSPVVARVTSGAAGVDPGDVIRELDVARHAARRGARVIEPADLADPGPHEHDGHLLVLWRYVEHGGPLDAQAAGRGLRALHHSLDDYDGDLPRAGRGHDVATMLDGIDSADADLLRELSARALPEGQALHGDAHLFNCMHTAAGPIWHDLETACRGPREYDLAALVHRERMLGDNPKSIDALEAYGAFDSDILEEAFLAYTAWITASWLVALPRRPELAFGVERQLEYLRTHHR